MVIAGDYSQAVDVRLSNPSSDLPRDVETVADMKAIGRYG
jgi:hypothetical protein